MAAAPLSLPMDTALQDRLEAEARRTQRSLAEVTEEAIKLYLAVGEAKREAVRAALKRADSGNFVDGDEGRIWIESWHSGAELPKPRSSHAGSAV